jgi:hypothetical protein
MNPRSRRQARRLGPFTGTDPAHHNAGVARRKAYKAAVRRGAENQRIWNRAYRQALRAGNSPAQAYRAADLALKFHKLSDAALRIIPAYRGFAEQVALFGAAALRAGAASIHAYSHAYSHAIDTAARREGASVTFQIVDEVKDPDLLAQLRHIEPKRVIGISSPEHPDLRSRIWAGPGTPGSFEDRLARFDEAYPSPARQEVPGTQSDYVLASGGPA